MKLKLERKILTAISTIGQLSVDGVPECWILEDTVRPAGTKVFGKTAIPAGTYKIMISMSPRFKRPLPLLIGVPNFEGIRIHPGNIAEDTEGCLLTGTSKGPNRVFESVKAFDKLFPKVEAAVRAGDEVTIEVV